jgi:UDP-N-acetylmuramate dehydrogenase
MIELPAFFSEILRENVSGKSLTTYGIGGLVGTLLEPRTLDEAISVFSYLDSSHIPYKIIGNGSNLVLPDNGISEAVVVRLSLRDLKPQLLIGSDRFEIPFFPVESCSLGDKVALEVPAGASMMSLSRQVTELGLSGLEYSAGIPGSLGGAVRMNAGAHGSDISNILSSIKIWDSSTARVVSRTKDKDLSFSYRYSSLLPSEVILSARLNLTLMNRDEVRENRASALKYRKETQPLSMPSAGSVFRNPAPDLSAAKILDDLGCKGMRQGGVMLSELHSNWIVRVSDDALADDVRGLVDKLKAKVVKDLGIELHEEIIFW